MVVLPEITHADAEPPLLDRCHQKLCGRPKLYTVWLELEYTITIFTCQTCINKINVLCVMAREVRRCISMAGVPSPFIVWTAIPAQLYSSGDPTPHLYYHMRYLFSLLNDLDNTLTWAWDGFNVLCQALDALESNLNMLRPWDALPLYR